MSSKERYIVFLIGEERKKETPVDLRKIFAEVGNIECHGGDPFSGIEISMDDTTHAKLSETLGRKACIDPYEDLSLDI